MIVLQIDRNFKSKIFFILPNRFSDQTDVTFKSFSKGASASFSSVSSPFTHLWCFQALQLFKVSFFTIFHIDDRLIPVCLAIFLGAKCVWGCSCCEQTNSSIKFTFSSIEIFLGCPDICFLSIEPVSLNFFKRRLTKE